MRALLFLFGLLLIGPYIFLSDGALRQDLSLRAEGVEPAYMETSNRKCTSTFRLFHQCSFDYAVNGLEQSQNYNMFAFGSPDTIVLLKGQSTGRLTSTTGLEYFWNRVFTMVFTLLLSFMTLISIIKRFSGSSSPATPNNLGAQNPAYAKQASPKAYSARASTGSSFGKRTSF